jgi:hypothetical protein
LEDKPNNYIQSINLLVGGVLGIVITITIFAFFENRGDTLGPEELTNFVIASVAILATALSFQSMRNQQIARRWEATKDILLDLAKALSDVSVQTGKFSEQEFEEMTGQCPDGKAKYDPQLSVRFRKLVTHTLDVYRPLLDPEIITSIEAYEKTVENIREAYVDHDALNAFEAYDQEWGAERQLLKVLNRQIKRYASI